MSARQRANQPGNALQESTSVGYGSHRIYANVKINNSAPVRFMVDSGADVSIMSTGSANQVKLNIQRYTAGSLNLVGVTGNNSAPLVNVAMTIESAPAFSTQIAVTNSNFNLLSIKDLSRSYDVNIRSGKATLIPRSPAAVNAINTISQPIVTPIPTFNFDDSQIKTGVLLVTTLLVLSVLS